MMPSFAIDFHTHIRVPKLAELARKHGQATSFRESADPVKPTGPSPIVRFTDPVLRFEEMRKARIDMQVISVNTLPQYYTVDADVGQELSRAANEGIADYVAAHSDRFVGIGMVPLQDAELAASELAYCVDTLKLKGVSISTCVRGEEIGVEKFWPFWEQADALRATVFVHPMGFTEPARMQKYRLFNTVGQPLEETLATLSLIHEGVLDKYPNVKIAIAHGGGYLPFYSGRSDSTYEHYPKLRGAATKVPSAYLKNLYFDSCIFDSTMLAYLVSRAGGDRIMLGSDFPYRRWDAVSMVCDADIPQSTKEDILWRNAARILNLNL